MALTTGDKQTIKTLLNELKHELKHELKQELTQEIKHGLKQELRETSNILKIHMDVQFKKIDSKLDAIAGTTDESKKNIIKAGKILENHEQRIEFLEQTHHPIS